VINRIPSRTKVEMQQTTEYMSQMSIDPKKGGGLKRGLIDGLIRGVIQKPT